MAMISALVAFLRTDVPVTPGADEARRWAQEELSNKAYQDAKPGWVDQLGSLILQAVQELLAKIGVAPAQTGMVIVGGIVLLAVLLVILLVRPRVGQRQRQSDAVFLGSPILSADQHRRRARDAASAGDFDAAVSEQFRALVRAGEERDVCTPAPGRTAVEIAAELAVAFPDHSAALHSCADVFNEVRYGQQSPTASMYEELAAADRALAAASPRYVQQFGDSLSARSSTAAHS